VDIALSRRVAKVLITEEMLSMSARERYDFVRRVSKYKKFEELPEEFKKLILSAEK
jgi:hypothetical protein